MNYYNEFDPFAAAWLRELISAKLIPRGLVDDRSITEVKAEDLEGFTQCHFFAGIGGWPLALQLAGVSHRTPLWTGSPPCQPFSVAGKQLGQLDERHLAPTFMRLVDQCLPTILFGEQVAAAIGKHWLDDLFTELERQGYACGSAVLPAASVGAPHKRDRLFFGAALADATQRGRGEERADAGGCAVRNSPEGWSSRYITGSRHSSVANSNDARPQGRGGVSERADQQPVGPGSMGGGVAYTSSERRQQDAGGTSENEAADGGARRDRGQSHGDNVSPGDGEIHAANPNHNFWSDVDWLGCRDGKFRPVESGTFPLANGVSARVGRLRGYGNAIVPQAAAEFIRAFMGAAGDAAKG